MSSQSPKQQSRPVKPHSTVASAPGMLSKSVFALAIEPLTMALTVTGRKAYDVMLWLAQRQPATTDGGYSSPVSAILKGYGSTTKASERVQRYIEQMVQTTVVWRPLAASEQGTMSLEGFEEAPHQVVTDEARTFPLLAEARLYMRGGEAWVTWYYPPSIKEQLISPDRWAQIELNSIARLTTYTGVALYEICARYKDSPGGLTSRHECEFWSRVLREGGGVKPREWRKFKSELLVPAMADINDKTEIRIELVEHRFQGAIHEVQFKVERQARDRDVMPEAADVTLALRAAKVGVKEIDLDAMLLKYGALKVVEGFDRLDVRLADTGKERVLNRLSYLKSILENKYAEDGQGGAALSAGDLRPVVVPDEVTERVERSVMVEAWKTSKQKAVRGEFAALPAEEQARWIDLALPILNASTAVTPAMRRRLAERDWESPLVSRVVLDVYAGSKYGPNWKEPTEIDLVMFSVAEGRRQ